MVIPPPVYMTPSDTDHREVSLDPSTLQAKKAQFPQPFLLVSEKNVETLQGLKLKRQP